MSCDAFSQAKLRYNEDLLAILFATHERREASDKAPEEFTTAKFAECVPVGRARPPRRELLLLFFFFFFVGLVRFELCASGHGRFPRARSVSDDHDATPRCVVSFVLNHVPRSV